MSEQDTWRLGFSETVLMRGERENSDESSCGMDEEIFRRRPEVIMVVAGYISTVGLYLVSTTVQRF